MGKGLYIKTFGCQMNEYDSGKMADVLVESRGFRLVATSAEAQVLILNTCSVREKAQAKLFSELGRWRALKQQDPDCIIAVGGCVASQEGEDIWRRAPYVDVIFGPQTLHRLPALIDQAHGKAGRVIDISFPEIEKFDRLPAAKPDGPSALVSIMEGCSKYCSFCVVPYTRGEEFSRSFDEVIAEIFGLVQQGVREVTLLGQNVNAYRGLTHDGKIVDLAALIRYLGAMQGIDRIRYTTSHPVEFSDRLIDVYAQVPELVSHVHLPVQSGSDRILSLMKRGHTVLEYKAKIKRLKKCREGISVSTDLIVGFPGETHDDFMKTLDLVDEINFDKSFSFIYSVRLGTPAATLPDDVSMEEKRHRLTTLQHRLSESEAAHNARMRGTVQRVLVTGAAKKNTLELSGRCENNRVVNFPGSRELIGRFVDIAVTDVLPNSLRGVISEATQALAR